MHTSKFSGGAPGCSQAVGPEKKIDLVNPPRTSTLHPTVQIADSRMHTVYLPAAVIAVALEDGIIEAVGPGEWIGSRTRYQGAGRTSNSAVYAGTPEPYPGAAASYFRKVKEDRSCVAAMVSQVFARVLQGAGERPRPGSVEGRPKYALPDSDDELGYDEVSGDETDGSDGYYEVSGDETDETDGLTG